MDRDEEDNDDDGEEGDDGFNEDFEDASQDIMPDDAFDVQDDDNPNYYDFAKDLQHVEFEIGFEEIRSLQNVCLLPNLDLIIEGPLITQTVEVYKISQNQGCDTKPYKIIQSNARGLSSVAFNEDVIYMGFIGSLMSPNLSI